MTVEYTCDDDGIHAVCSCGWRKVFDFWPHPYDVANFAASHLALEKLKERISLVISGQVPPPGA